MTFDQHQEKQMRSLQKDIMGAINIDHLTEVYFRSVAERMIKAIVDAPDDAVPDLSGIYANANIVMQLGIKKAFKELWYKAFKLGLTHQVETILYSNKKIKRLWDKKYKEQKFDSSFGTSPSLVAFFGIEEDINRADNELDRLGGNIGRAESEGIFDDLSGKGSIPGRYTPRERANFLYSLREISDIRRRAEASQFNYITDTYMQQRTRVLSRDVSDKFDNNTKKAVTKFLSKDTRYYNTIKQNKAYARNAQLTLAKELEKATLEEINQKEGTKKRRVDETTRRKLYKRAEAVLRTEISFAYNVGKLIGYASPLDSQKNFQWRADWELQSRRSGYKVCDYCEAMDGRVFTAEQLLAASMRIDGGIATYDGTRRSKTDFKNPSLPSIPGHVNCQCRFVRYITQEEIEREREREEDYEYERRRLGEEQVATKQQSLSDVILPAVIGTTLLVGAGFLLARSNVWKRFYQQAMEAPLTALLPEEKVLDAVGFIDDTFDTSTSTVVKQLVVAPVEEADSSDAATEELIKRVLASV